MPSRRPETMAKRARELAAKEKRERKLAKKAARAAGREAGPVLEADGLEVTDESPDGSPEAPPEP
jgi:hypothetical protein